MIAAAALLCGCNHLSTGRELIGTWRSEDGHTVCFSGDGGMYLYDLNGQPVFEEPLMYGVSTSVLYTEREGQTVELFECRIDGDRLTLVYTEQLLHAAGIDSADSISLVRVGD